MESISRQQPRLEQSPHDPRAMPAQLSGHWLRIVHVGWSVTAIVALLIIVLALPIALQAIKQGAYLQGHDETFVINPDAQPTTFDIAFTTFAVVVSLIAVSVSLLLSTLIFWRRSKDRIAVFVSFYLLYIAIVKNGPLELMEIYIPGIAIFTADVLTSFSSMTLTVVLLCLFPDGRFVPRWSRWLPLASVLMLPIVLYSYFRYGQFLSGPLLPFAVPVWAVTLLLAFYAQIYRYRQVSSRAERQQTKWIIYGFGLWLLLSLLSAGPYLQGRSLAPDETQPLWLALFGTLTYLPSLLVMPMALTIAVLRYRLWNIDVIINRTLVYGALTTTVIGIYVIVVGTLGALFHAGGDFLISLLATGVVAVLFQPLRERLQRRVNRLMFGKRDEPLIALAQLGKRLEAAHTPEEVLPALVETIAYTLKLPYVAISLKSGDEFSIATEVGNKMANSLHCPLIYQGEAIGYLIASPRGQVKSFNQADRQLLENIAHQAGPAAYAVQLTYDLYQSRVRLVTAREEERRRLRRDLHDGLGPVLASQGLKMAAVSQLLQNDPAQARRLLEELTAQNEATVAEIRRLVYELRPAALDDLGLVGAVCDYASHLKGETPDSPRLQIDVQVSGDGLPALPAAIEVAAYRISTEALTNIAHHAHARKAIVSFVLDSGIHMQKLRLEIVDDGIGLPENHKSGIGLISMRERAEEVGGSFFIESLKGNGTCVIANFPLVKTK